MKEKMLFVCHRGQCRGRTRGVIANNYCLPIAFSVPDYRHSEEMGEAAVTGLHACWQYHIDEDFFREIDLDHAPDSGLWVYEVEYSDHDAKDDEHDPWYWLAGGKLRRPTVEELAPLAEGKPPWPGGKAL